MNSRTLLNISDDLLALEQLLVELDGDVTDASAEQAIDTWLAELGGERNAKLDSYARLISAIEGDADTIAKEVDRLRARQKSLDNRVSRLKARLEFYFTTNGIERIETPNFTFAMQKSGGKPKVLLAEFYAENPVELPEGLRRVKFEADLNAIREKLEADDPSVIGIASLDTPSKKLRIK